MFQRRLTILYWLITFLFAFLLGKAFFMQILEGEYYEKKEKACRLRKEFIPFERGRIFDRRGVPLAYDQTLCHLSFRSGDFSRHSTLWALARVMEMARVRASSSRARAAAFFKMGNSLFLRSPSKLYRKTLEQRAEELLGTEDFSLSAFLSTGKSVGPSRVEKV